MGQKKGLAGNGGRERDARPRNLGIRLSCSLASVGCGRGTCALLHARLPGVYFVAIRLGLKCVFVILTVSFGDGIIVIDFFDFGVSCGCYIYIHKS